MNVHPTMQAALNTFAPPQQPDTKPGHYYVSVINGARYGLLLGPFADHAAALARVDETRRLAVDMRPEAHFYAFGTLRLDLGDPRATPGVLNALLGL